MNLIVDIGNSQTKYALFRNEKMLEYCVSENQDLALIKQWQIKYPELDAAIISSVQEKPIRFLNALNETFSKLIFFDQNTPTPLENLYESKATLGYDRLAACVGANAICPHTDILVIDAGTAITFEFVNANNQYLGGNISPGLNMRFKALNVFTKKLPLVEQSDTFSLIGKNTPQAIISGVQNSLLFEIEGYIKQFGEGKKQFAVFLTGGDSDFIYANLKSKTVQNKYLLLSGLNTILNYNNS